METHSSIVRTVVIAVLAFVLVTFAVAAFAHDWYERECCSGRDCAELPQQAVKEKPDGYHITIAAGEHLQVHEPKSWVVPYGDKRIRMSPDGLYHACIQPLSYMEGHITGGEIICLYVPGRMG